LAINQISEKFQVTEEVVAKISDVISNLYSLDGPPLTKLKRTVSDSEKWRYVSYNITKLQPGSLVNISEIMGAPLAISVDINEIDRRFDGKIQVEYSIQIPVIVESGNDLDVRKISLSTIRANSLKDAQPQIEAFMRKRILKQSSDRPGFFSHFQWLKPSLSNEVFILYAEDSTCNLDTPFTRTHVVKSIDYGR
jgi:hypothetical protein